MRHFGNVFLFSLTLVLALACCDVYLQLADIQTPMETRVDPLLGPTYIPGKPISRFNEGFFLGEANAYGYMGPAVPPRRADAEPRILLLGDSFVLGHTVLPRHHFARRLEELLGEATGETVHVLNFGKADFDLGDMYAYYCDFAGKFDHDLALFFVDETDLIPEGKAASSLYPVVKVVAGALVVDRSFRDGWTYRFYRAIAPVLTRSAVLRLAFNAYKMAIRGELPRVLLDKFAPAGAPAQPRAGSSALAALSTTARALPELSGMILRDLARDPRNVLVIHKNLPLSLRDDVRRAGLPILDLGASLAELEARGEDPYYWPVTRVRGHWNHRTHQRVAAFLADALASEGLLWPDAPGVTRKSLLPAGVDAAPVVPTVAPELSVPPSKRDRE